MEVQFTEEVTQLRLGAGAIFHGESILAITKALRQSGVSCVGAYQVVPISHRLEVMVQAKPQRARADRQSGALQHAAACLEQARPGRWVWPQRVATAHAQRHLPAGARPNHRFLRDQACGDGAATLSQ